MPDLFQSTGGIAGKKKTNPVLNVGKKILDISARPSQGVLHFLQNESGRGISGFDPRVLAQSVRAGAKAVGDTDGTNDINLRQASGVDKNAGGLAGGILDFVGSSVLDPTMYLGVGELRAASKIGKAGIEALAKGSPELAAKVGKVGYSALKPSEQKAARSILMGSEAAGNARGDKALTSLYRQATGRAGRSGAEKFTSKLIGGEGELAPLGKLLEPQGAKIAGKVVLKKTTVDSVARATGLTALSAAAKGSRAGSAIGRAAEGAKSLVKPRNRVAGEQGAEGAAVLGDAESRSRAFVNNALENMSNQVIHSVSKANITDKELRMMTDALDRGKIPQLVKHFGKKGRQDAAKLASTLEKIKSDADTAIQNADSIGRTVTTGPTDILEKIPGTVARAGDAAGTGTQRDLFGMGGKVADASSAGAREAAKVLGRGAAKAAGGEPARVTGQRAGETYRVGEQMSLLDNPMVQGLLRTPTRELKRLLNSKPDELASALGVTAETASALLKDITKLAPGKTIQEINKEFGPKLGIAKLFEEDPIRAVLAHGKEISRDLAFGRMLHELAQETLPNGTKMVVRAGDGVAPKGYQVVNSKTLGKFYAAPSVARQLEHTVTLLDDQESLHTLSRVAQGFTQLWRTQATSSLLFGLGFQARNLFGNVFNMWEKGFDDPAYFKDANKLRSAVVSGSKKGMTWQAAIRASKLSGKEKRALAWMMEDGIVGSSFLRTDLKQAGVAVRRGQRWAQRFDPRSSESLITLNKPGHELAQFIEDNSRMAMWLSEFAKTGSRKQATRAVKETLFDYGDLTKAERALKNWAVPFYTWQRKNLGLQLWALENAPGKIAALDRLRDEIAAAGPDTAGQEIPGYARDANQIPLFNIDGTPVLGTVVSPVEAAANFVQPLADLGQFVTGQNPQGLQRSAAGVTNLIGGAPGSLAKQGVSEAAGVNLFTGAPLKPGRTAAADRYAKALLPTYGRIMSVGGAVTDSPVERKAKIISQSTGLQLTPLTKERQKSAALRSKAEGAKIRKKKSKKIKKSLYDGG